MKLYERYKQYNNKADSREAIKTIESEIKPVEVKTFKTQFIIDSWLLLRRRITKLKCKEFKDLSSVFVICSVIIVHHFYEFIIIF